MPKIVVSDFDDTLFMNGVLNQAVYDLIDSADAPLYVVTGRHESVRAETVQSLQDLGVTYSRLIMQPDGEDNSANYKGATAEKLLADGYDIVFVVENNAEARAAYKSAGVETVVDPASLPNEIDGVRSMEDMIPVSKEELGVKFSKLQANALELIGHLTEVIDEVHDLIEHSHETVLPLEQVVEVLPEQDASMDVVRFVEPSKVADLHQRGERVSKGIEHRIIVRDLEIRSEDNGMTLRGYAAVFNSPSEPLPFVESIRSGAFAQSLLSRNDIKLLWNHDTGSVLGSTRAGTLVLTEDAHGLSVVANLPDTQLGRDAAILIQRGDVNAFSFGFRVPVGGDVWSSDGATRELTRVNLHEVSVGVAFPAYSATEGTATVRNIPDLQAKITAFAELRGISAEELTDALMALESGAELTERQGELLTDTLSKVLEKSPEGVNPNDLLDMKKKQLDLIMTKI